MSTVSAPSARPLADPLFRRLWLGEGLAAATQALFLVCLTLLVLELSGPGPTVGLVLAVAALPRALLLPFGGLLADRQPPERIMALTTGLRTVALAALAVLVVLGTPPIVVVAVLAGLLGALDGAYYPAALAVLPRVVAARGLSRANALVQGFESAGDLLGPAAAAGLVAATGLGGAFGAVTGLCLLAATALMLFLRLLGRRHTPSPGDTADTTAEATDQLPLGSALRAGLRFARERTAVRAILLVLAVLNIAVFGPVLVGTAVLAEQHFGGADQLGVVLAGFGAGALLGLLTAGYRTPTRVGPVLLLGTATIGVGTAGFAFVTGTAMAAAVAAVIGVGHAYLSVVLVTWLHHNVPEELRGRVMSLVMIAVLAFDPLSYALAGLLVGAGTTVMFTVCGAVVLTTAALAATSSTVRGLG